MKNRNRSTAFHVPTIYASAKIVLGELRAVFVDRRTNSALKHVEFLNTAMSYGCTISNPLLQMSFNCTRLPDYSRRDKKKAWKDCLKVTSAGLSETSRSLSQVAILHSQKHW